MRYLTLHTYIRSDRTRPHEVYESSQPGEQRRCTKRPSGVRGRVAYEYFIGSSVRLMSDLQPAAELYLCAAEAAPIVQRKEGFGAGRV